VHLDAERVVARDVVRHLEGPAGHDVCLRQGEVVEQRVLGGRRRQRGQQGEALTGDDQPERGAATRPRYFARGRPRARQRSARESQAREQGDGGDRGTIERHDAQEEPDDRPGGGAEQSPLGVQVGPRRWDPPEYRVTEPAPREPDQAGQNQAGQRREESGEAEDGPAGERAEKRRGQRRQPADVLTAAQQEGRRE
jgi:hypothetical protein